MTRINHRKKPCRPRAAEAPKQETGQLGNLRRDLLSLGPLPSQQTAYPATLHLRRSTAWPGWPACRAPSLQTPTSFPEGLKEIAHHDGMAAHFHRPSASRRRLEHVRESRPGARSPLPASPFSEEEGFAENSHRRSMTERIECPHLPKETQSLERTAGGRNQNHPALLLRREGSPEGPDIRPAASSIMKPGQKSCGSMPRIALSGVSFLTRRSDWPGRHPSKPRSGRYVIGTRRNRIDNDEIPTKSATHHSEPLFTNSESNSITASGRNLPLLSNRALRRITRTPRSSLPTYACN